MSTQYVYGDISAVTVGKVFRMFGSKLELPEKIANSGFEKEVVVRDHYYLRGRIWRKKEVF